MVDLWEARAKPAIGDAFDRRLLRSRGRLKRCGWICIWERAESSIRAFEFFQDFLLEPRGFFNPSFALHGPQVRRLAGIQLHHVYLISD
jgi:hypothetical protein